MGTKVGIVYAAGSKMIRRIIVPDRDGELNDQLHVMPGEVMLKVDKALGFSVAQASAHVFAATGVQPLNPRHALINPAGRVVRIVHADPTLDPPGAQLTMVQTDVADVDWTWDEINGFQPPPPPPSPGP
jgi:hypothetical protein